MSGGTESDEKNEENNRMLYVYNAICWWML